VCGGPKHSFREGDPCRKLGKEMFPENETQQKFSFHKTKRFGEKIYGVLLQKFELL
jgi:hypothetical protein